jgi:hypothetical protein
VAEPTHSGTNHDPEEPVNEARAHLYRRLMDAQEQIAVRLYRRGFSDRVVQDALDVVDEELSDADRREDLYVSALARFVGALGGRIEVRAVFDEEEVLVRREPAA